jgi:hypothetical protein
MYKLPMTPSDFTEQQIQRYLDHWANEIGVSELLEKLRTGQVPPKST